ncbi:dihydroxyacetone kinase DhaK subunit [Granulicatella balaenopterae]|uniref:Dihydroxyacetone kinase DhaK subunit n=1 Tax=Granulicatella balaenopterae TaxID=137733 RepID=A0A1H9N476_9LACT|nr:dihydroxyacetone kinase subunit DhaK [Granulicatella balaenopterae]SER30587.1 dihydroxyacetone kinase DhaK subunit [Granulicatella balaenopterae]
MKKIINDPKNVVTEMLAGLTYAYGGIVEKLPDFEVIKRTAPKTGKVALVSGGGSGHEPSHAGFVGDGMLSAAVCGAVFTSPTPDQIFEAIQAVDEGQGVFLIIKNYSGDIMNFEMAKEMAEMEDIDVEFVVVDDDIAVEDSLYTQGKRGVAGTVLVHKILGAAARKGASLAEIKELADQIVPNIKTIGVALSGATVPEVGKPGFVLADDEMEYGVGIHGEPGYRKETLKPSKELAAELIGKLKAEFEFNEGDQFALLVNGLGATPLMELFVFTQDVAELLNATPVTVPFKKVGNYMTAIDMAGLSVTLMKVTSELVDYLNEDVTTIAW